MLLKQITLRNYRVFPDATFDLRTTFERPIILFTGNNGAGKTSTLEAFRLALYGRRAFVGLSDEEIQASLRAKFCGGNLSQQMSIALSFDYSDIGETHSVELVRSWRLRRKTIGESLSLTVDGCGIGTDLADDLLSKIVPAEVFRYFFFDAERIADITDWEGDDDSTLFASVNELLGLDLASQLERDLEHVVLKSTVKPGPSLESLNSTLAQLESRLVAIKDKLKTKRHELSVATRMQEACRRRFTALGGVFAEDRTRDETELSELQSQRDAIEQALRDDAASIMPLLIAPRVFGTMKADVAKSETLEILAVIQHAITESEGVLTTRIAELVGRDQIAGLIKAIRESLLPKPVALDHEPLDLSLREASWMRTVLNRELPALCERLAEMANRHRDLVGKMEILLARLKLAPKGDGVLIDAIGALENATGELTRAQDSATAAQAEFNECTSAIETTREELRKARHEAFRGQRLSVRDSLINKVAAMLPEFADQLRRSKETRFAEHLFESIERLWHKEGRLKSVVVDFKQRNIDLVGTAGTILKRDLSAAEKQLFAIAFIFSLAKLSNRNLPFVVDTPLARLDKAHRLRLLSEFLPNSTHQAILFSTDTEVVGSLLDTTKPFIARQYELADYNGGITQPVQLAIAL
ncbi:MAG TPA: DNA sulfur modification protein DndD [Candidatus Rubrimentiphilum sp.]|nr:DNA sulfur modification protein DndD [Candidatus Rubrimentiphilum sp.]